ncbi:tol-pal system-associated acyl-CoA thioesterase [Rubrivivax rivuli]|uniref:Tol-pal system-associated acyl-CoA thioesterase n=1 Tax=Rubrivivax rivuli TaxID=1862385 RepID=A0A437RCD7_9BURK|nr:tol-pal system-associated acyl-CoA thioesterase [Rubrivivax rivuli]RVU44446.1 tol-pal system-associated acyl-CoA thioesterase [Rubrivivax rivuli]
MPPSPSNTPVAAPFEHSLRVYWEDTDAGGVVFYANYLKFFERARTEWLRSLGVGQQALREATGAIFIVAETQLRYIAPARLDDALRVTVHLQQRGHASLHIQQQAWRGDTLLCEGRIRIGCVDEGTFRPRRIPNEVLSTLT